MIEFKSYTNKTILMHVQSLMYLVILHIKFLTIIIKYIWIKNVSICYNDYKIMILTIMIINVITQQIISSTFNYSKSVKEKLSSLY